MTTIPIKNRNNSWVDIQPKLTRQYSNILNAFIYKNEPLDRWDIAKICNLPITTVSGRITEMCNYMYMITPVSADNNRTKYVLLPFDKAINKCTLAFTDLMSRLDELEHTKLVLNKYANSITLNLIEDEINRIQTKLSKISTLLECQKKI